MPAALSTGPDRRGLVSWSPPSPPSRARAAPSSPRTSSTWRRTSPSRCTSPRQQYAQKNPELVKKFQEATAESLAYADAHPDEVREIITTYTKIPAERAGRRSTCPSGPPRRTVPRSSGWPNWARRTACSRRPRPGQAAAVRGADAALGAAGLAGFLALGEAVPRLGVVKDAYLPPVSRIADALADELADERLLDGARRHAHRLGAWAWLIAVTAGHRRRGRHRRRARICARRRPPRSSSCARSPRSP